MNTINLRLWTRRWLQRHGLTISRERGQHFLICEQVLHNIIDHASISPSDVILEIGAGIGTLTTALAQRAGHVFSIEKDEKLYKTLKAELDNHPRITLIRGDAVKIEWPSCDKLVANLPYTISSPVLFRFLTATKIPLAVLMLQREFANRLTAKAGTKEYGRLTVMTYYLATVKLIEYVEPSCFYPRPQVTSALVRIDRRPKPAFDVSDFNLFFQLVKVLFGQRRKKIRTPLRTLLHDLKLPSDRVNDILMQVPWVDKRAEQLTPEQLATIANLICEATECPQH